MYAPFFSVTVCSRTIQSRRHDHDDADDPQTPGKLPELAHAENDRGDDQQGNRGRQCEPLSRAPGPVDDSVDNNQRDSCSGDLFRVAVCVVNLPGARSAPSTPIDADDRLLDPAFGPSRAAFGLWIVCVREGSRRGRSCSHAPFTLRAHQVRCQFRRSRRVPLFRC